MASLKQLQTRVEEVTDAHIAAHARLSAAEYGDAAVADPAHLRWKYLENPSGRAKAVHVFDGDQLVARLVALPGLFARDERRARAAYIVDLLVHPAYRGMATLLQLFQGFKQLQSDFDFVLITPNSAGLPVWEAFAKIKHRFDLGVAALPLHPGKMLQKYGKGRIGAFATAAEGIWRATLRLIVSSMLTFQRTVTLDSETPSESELLELLQQRSSSREAVGRRDAAFLKWRFSDSPVFHYDTYFVRKNGALAGFIVLRRTQYMGYDAHFVIDAFGPGMTAQDWKACMCRIVLKDLDRNGPELLMLLGNTACPPLSLIGGFPLFRVPERVLPHRPLALFEWWSPQVFEITPQSFQLTLADCDMI